MVLSIIILSLICLALMATMVIVVREVNKNDNYKLEKFLGTVSYLSWAWSEPISSENELVPLDEMWTDELLSVLQKNYEWDNEDQDQ